MGQFVKSGRGLVLAVAGSGQGGEVRVVDVAVGNHVQGWQSVGQDIGIATISYTVSHHNQTG
jgi:hypothetical protein